MAHEFHLPDIGEGLTEAVIVHWHVAVGDEVGMDEPLVEVETDKAVVDIPSPVAGVVLHQGAGPGDSLEVEELLAVIGSPGESWTLAADPAPVVEAAPIVGTLGEGPVVAQSASGPQALPRVRKLAAELGIDLAEVVGTGPGGRINEDDLLSARRPATHRGPVERRPMSPTRRTIAEHLARSWREIPHVTTYGEADATGLIRWRAELDRPTLEALLVQIVMPLLRRHPSFNATLEGTEVVEKHYYDIGVAIDAPDGLMVGVLRDAGERSIPDLDVEIRSLAERVKSRSASVDELRGQTFTVSNIGAVGGGYGTPIIPLGTTAIASFGRAADRPVVRDGIVAVAPMLPISLSYDHRVIDGGKGRAFMADLVAAIEAL